MKGFPDLPPIWFAGAWGLVWGIARLFPNSLIELPAQTALGWGFTLTGLGLIAWSAFWFWKKRTTIEPHHQATSLLVEGPFRISRNPIYLGFAIILVGAIVSRGAWLSFPVLVGFVFIIQSRFIAQEEAGLKQVFGEEADAYLAKTRRWI